MENEFITNLPIHDRFLHGRALLLCGFDVVVFYDVYCLCLEKLISEIIWLLSTFRMSSNQLQQTNLNLGIRRRWLNLPWWWLGGWCRYSTDSFWQLRNLCCRCVEFLGCRPGRCGGWSRWRWWMFSLTIRATATADTTGNTRCWNTRRLTNYGIFCGFVGMDRR